MKKYRMLSIILSSVLVLSLSGCASAIPELSADEQDMVTQYMADMLLKYDVNYQASLLEGEELAIALEEQREKEEAARLEAEEQERLEQEKVEASKPDDIEITDTPQYAGVDSMADASNLENVAFDYLGYELTSRYPNADEGELVFAMTPTAGNELLIMKFNLANIRSIPVQVMRLK